MINTLEKYIKEFIRTGDSSIFSKENILLNVSIKDIGNFIKKNPNICNVETNSITILIHTKYNIKELVIRFNYDDTLYITLESISITLYKDLSYYIYNKYLTSIISESTLHEVLEKIQDAINIFKVENLDKETYNKKFIYGINRVKTFITKNGYTLLYSSDINNIENTIRSGNRFNLVYLIPELKVTNSFDKYHIIRDVLIFNIYEFNILSGSYKIYTYFTRAGFTEAEINSEYIQSHISRDYFKKDIKPIINDIRLYGNSTIRWIPITSMCLGNNPLRQGFECNKSSDLYIHERMILNTFGWESLEGGPYIAFSKIQASNSNLTQNLSITESDIKTLSKDIITSMADNIMKCYIVGNNSIDIDIDYIEEYITNNETFNSNPIIYNSFKEDFKFDTISTKDLAINILESNITVFDTPVYVNNIVGDFVINIGDIEYKSNEISIKIPFKIYSDNKTNKFTYAKTVNPIILEIIYSTLMALLLKVDSFIIK